MQSFKDLSLEPIHLAYGQAFTSHGESSLLIAHMARLLDLGHICLPCDDLSPQDQDFIHHLVKSCEPHLISFKEESKATPLYFENNCLYIHKAFRAELTFCEELKRYLSTFDHDNPLPFEEDPTCNEQQNEAIKKALEPGMLLLTGGPGTGKTYTAKKIALQLLEKSHFFKKVLILAAPTSKALEQLKKSIGTLPDDTVLIADTLHKLVEFKSKKPAYLNGSCIIVDEASMIEAPLMAKLFASLGSKAKLILMGDTYQLPPVGLGAFFHDLLQLKNQSCFIKHVHLNEVKRCSDSSLQTLSGLINEKSFEELEDFLQTNHTSLTQIKDPLDAFSKECFSIMCEFFSHEPYYHNDLNSLSNLKFSSIILSTLKKGPLGVDAINQKLHDYFFVKQTNKRFFIEPIMILENAKDEELFNGEIGLKITDRQESRMQFFIKNRFISNLEISYTFSFALSVHKSQGSEYDHVLFMVPEGSEKFSREIIYTACTRVKKSLKLWFAKDPFKAAMIKKTSRFSGVLKRFTQKLDP